MPSLLVPDTVSRPPKVPGIAKPLLLVVDDEEGPRTSLKVVFKNEYEVLLASNGEDAIKLARTNKVDVAILDILMHGMSGVDVLRELKNLDEDIEVIMLTAYETLETARQALTSVPANISTSPSISPRCAPPPAVRSPSAAPARNSRWPTSN